MIRTPMASKVDLWVSKLARRYIVVTGSTRRTKIMTVMSTPTRVSMREEE